MGHYVQKTCAQCKRTANLEYSSTDSLRARREASPDGARTDGEGDSGMAGEFLRNLLPPSIPNTPGTSLSSTAYEQCKQCNSGQVT